MSRSRTYSVYCSFPLSFQIEVIALKSASKIYNLKFCLLNSMYDFFEFAKTSSYVNFYDMPFSARHIPTVRFGLVLDLDYSRDALIYSMLSEYPSVKRPLIIRNVYIHTARKLIKANNPELNIFVFNFNETQKKGGKNKC